MDVSLMMPMKELEEENRRLKKLYIEPQIKADIVAGYARAQLPGSPRAEDRTDGTTH